MFGNGEGTGWGAGPLNNGESHGFGQGLCGGNGREDSTCFGVGDGSGNGVPPLPHPWPPIFLYYGCGSGTGLIGLSNYKSNISIIESINGKKIYPLDFVPTIISSVFGF